MRCDNISCDLVVAVFAGGISIRASWYNGYKTWPTTNKLNEEVNRSDSESRSEVHNAYMLAFVSSINGNYAVVLIELRDTNFWEANTIRWKLFF